MATARFPSTNLQVLGKFGQSLVFPIAPTSTLRLSRVCVSGGNSAVVQTREELMSSESLAREGEHLFQYPDGPSEATFSKYATAAELSTALCHFVVECCTEAVKRHGKFSIVLSGGSIVKALAPLAKKPFSDRIPWDAWHVFWVDERVVPLNHPDSNYKLANDTFLSAVPVPREQVHTIDNFEDATAAAEAYEAKLREIVKKKIVATRNNKKYPRFDLVVLGLGPDGHIASLFPNSVSLAEKKRWVLPITNSPKPPPNRITITLPCINCAENVAMVAMGNGKAGVVERVLERAALPGSLPAQMVRVKEGKLMWFVDDEAASMLSIDKWGNPKQFPFFDFSKPKAPLST